MPAYMILIRRDPLGSGPPSFETVGAIGDNQASVLQLVKTALRLDGDEMLEIARGLTDHEVATLGLKAFQVKHL
jgi:hypothetical protein